MPRSLLGLIVLGVKVAIVVIVATLALVAVIYICMGIGALVNIIGQYFGLW